MKRKKFTNDNVIINPLCYRKSLYFGLDHIRFPWSTEENSQVYFNWAIVLSIRCKQNEEFFSFAEKIIKKFDYIISSSLFLLNWTISMGISYYFEYFVVFSHYLRTQISHKYLQTQGRNLRTLFCYSEVFFCVASWADWKSIDVWEFEKLIWNRSKNHATEIESIYSLLFSPGSSLFADGYLIRTK